MTITHREARKKIRQMRPSTQRPVRVVWADGRAHWFCRSVAQFEDWLAVREEGGREGWTEILTLDRKTSRFQRR